MSHKRIISISLGEEDLWDIAEKQRYIWIKTKNGFITTDELCDYLRIKTRIYDIWILQEDYGKTWAFTKDELMEE